MGRSKLPKNDDWAAKRKEVLLVAARQFAERGLDGVSLREIAAETGLHMSTLYHYFPNKAQLYTDVCVWAFGCSSALSLSMMDGEGDSRTKLRRYVDANVRFIIEKGTAIRILEQELLFGASSTALEYPTVMVAPITRLAALISDFSPPLLTVFSADRLAEIVWDVIYGVSRYSPVTSKVMNREDQANDPEHLSEEVWRVVSTLLGIEAVEAAQRPAKRPTLVRSKDNR